MTQRPKAAHASRAEIVESLVQAVGQLVLVVEDNADDEFLTLRSLKLAGVARNIVVVRDGREALDYFYGDDAAERPLPALVLLDLNLPRVAGFEVLSRLKAHDHTRDVPVVVLTASNDENDVEGSRRGGAAGCLRKPLNAAEIARVMRDLGLLAGGT